MAMFIDTGCKVKPLLYSPLQQICLFILSLLDVRLLEALSASNHVHIILIVQVSYQMHIRIFQQKFQSLPLQSNPLIA